MFGIPQVKQHIPDIEYKEIGLDKDHMHLHMIIPPKYKVSKVVNKIKANTSRELKNKFSFLKEVYWDEGGIWSRGYFVSTIGIDEKIIQDYVKQQGEEDASESYARPRLRTSAVRPRVSIQ